jgi:NAD(P)-dependent dehydrogenase (short-subunit alcohol dehydrogenase family)
VFRLDGKSAIITGGGSGIGRAIAHRFAKSGARVHLVDLNKGQGESTAREISSQGGEAQVYECDVANHEQVNRVFAQILKQGRVHILVNNAGIAHIGKLEGTSESDFDRIFRVNVKGVYNCMFASIGHMKANGGGAILNLASIAASSGLADRFAYSMSKGAIVSMTYSVAKDYLADKIRCNCISPARVHTPFVDGYLRDNYPGREKEMFDRLAHTQPIGRMGDAAEIAMLVLFLCSDEAGFITGTDYPIDGGYLTLRG